MVDAADFNWSARGEIRDVEPPKFGEANGGEPMPIPSQAAARREGVETRRVAPKAVIGHGEGIVQTTNAS